jgi:hypothetical protein
VSNIRPRSASVFLPATSSTGSMVGGTVGEGHYVRDRTLSASDIPQDAADTLGLLLGHDPSEQLQVGGLFTYNSLSRFAVFRN